jgi:hypothetical protein
MCVEQLSQSLSLPNVYSGELHPEIDTKELETFAKILPSIISTYSFLRLSLQGGICQIIFDVTPAGVTATPSTSLMHIRFKSLVRPDLKVHLAKSEGCHIFCTRLNPAEVCIRECRTSKNTDASALVRMLQYCRSFRTFVIVEPHLNVTSVLAYHSRHAPLILNRRLSQVRILILERVNFSNKTADIVSFLTAGFILQGLSTILLLSSLKLEHYHLEVLCMLAARVRLL